MQYRVSKKMSPVKLSAETFRKDDQRLLKNKYSNNSSVATNSAVSVCARLLVQFHTCSKLHICTYNRINLVPRVFALGELNTLVWSGHVTRGFCVKWRFVY
jgi:hypothetical protein